MDLTPKGKIGRLPKTLREDVNRRLENGQKLSSFQSRLQPTGPASVSRITHLSPATTPASIRP